MYIYLYVYINTYMFVYLYVYICVHENFLYLSLQCLVVFDILLTIKFFTFFYCYDYDNKLYQSFDR